MLGKHQSSGTSISHPGAWKMHTRLLHLPGFFGTAHLHTKSHPERRSHCLQGHNTHTLTRAHTPYEHSPNYSYSHMHTHTHTHTCDQQRGFQADFGRQHFPQKFLLPRLCTRNTPRREARMPAKILTVMMTGSATLALPPIDA